MEKLPKIDASPEVKGEARDLRAESPHTTEEFEILLARYKAQSPEQYEKKLANGTFDKQAKTLGFAWESPEAKVKEVEAKTKAKAEVEAKEAEAKAKK